VLITATADDDVYRLFQLTCDSVGSRIFWVGTDITFQKLSSSYKGQIFRLRGLSRSYDDLTIPLIGEHQLLNAASAIGAVEALRFHGVEVPGDVIASGLRGVKWPGRLEVMQTKPLVVLDGAKDAVAAEAVKEALLSVFTYDHLVAIVSISSDKKIAEMIGEIAQAADHFVITSHRVMGRAAKSSRIAAEVERHHRTFEVVADVRTAINRAIELAGEKGMVLVVGSVFLVGEAREIWHEPSNPFYHLEYGY
jgi:dihydrofolate synthase/folylpolyglutamate synthase